MNITYTLKYPIGKRQNFMFDGIIYATDVLQFEGLDEQYIVCLLYTSPSPRDS